MKPITPDEVAVVKQATLPDFVVRAFNECIATGWNADAKESVFLQDDVVRLILEYGAEHIHDRQEIFDKRWLDVEPIYQSQGWNVEYDKPAYNETYSATFTFSPKF